MFTPYPLKLSHVKFNFSSLLGEVTIFSKLSFFSGKYDPCEKHLVLVECGACFQEEFVFIEELGKEERFPVLGHDIHLKENYVVLGKKFL